MKNTQGMIKKLSYEFTVFTDIAIEEEVPVYHVLTDEQKEQFRAENPGINLIPTRIKTGETVVEQKLLRKDAQYLRRVPNVSQITISEVFSEKGNKYGNRFLVLEQDGSKYIVKGKYKEFKKYLDSINHTNKISY